MDYSCILENLFVGSCPRSTTDIDLLIRDYGITAVLCLQTDEDIRYLSLDFERIQASYTSYGITLKRVPIRDFDPVDLREKLPESVRVLMELLEARKKVYVHCTAGCWRSPSIIIAFLHCRLGWTLDQAVSHLKNSHPCTPDVEAIRLASEHMSRGSTAAT